MTIGERIGDLAKKKKINLHKLAEMAEISYNTLYSIVRRKSDKVDPETVRKIAVALKVPIWELAGGKVDGDLISFQIDEETAALLGVDNLEGDSPEIRYLDTPKAQLLMARLFGNLSPDSYTAAILSGTEDKYEEKMKEKEKAFHEARDAEDDKFRRSVIEAMRDDIDGFVDSDNGLWIIQSYLDLNEEGQFEAVKRIMELAQIPKYQRANPEEPLTEADAEQISPQKKSRQKAYNGQMTALNDYENRNV